MGTHKSKRVGNYSSQSDQSSVMIFLMQSDGHNPNYVQWLAEAWHYAQVDACLDIVVTPAFIEQHSELCQTIADIEDSRVKIIPLTAEEFHRSRFRSTPAGRIAAQWPWLYRRTRLRAERLREWQLCRTYAVRLGSDQVLFLNFDFYQALPAAGASLPCRFSGIYHNPSYHYANLFSQKLSGKEQIRALGQRLQVTRVLRNPTLHTLFFHDPFLAEMISSQQPDARA